MSTFQPFPRLPLELRHQIWRSTVEPRTVEVSIDRSRPRTARFRFLTSPTPVPGPLQSCREARKELQGLYQQAFFDVNTRNGPEQRYVWINFDIDMVDIGVSEFRDFESIASKIKRLKFERENTDEFFYYTENQQLLKFVHAEEIHVVCADGFWNWGGALYEHPWPCTHDKLVFFDPTEGLVAGGMELERICRQMLKDARLAATGEAFSTDGESDG
jgi:hypothetical protein